MLTVNRLSRAKTKRIFDTLSSVFDEDGRPEHRSSSVFSRLSLNAFYHVKTCAEDKAESLYALLPILSGLTQSLIAKGCSLFI